jgi:hypothetical protein
VSTWCQHAAFPHRGSGQYHFSRYGVVCTISLPGGTIPCSPVPENNHRLCCNQCNRSQAIKPAPRWINYLNVPNSNMLTEIAMRLLRYRLPLHCPLALSRPRIPLPISKVPTSSPPLPASYLIISYSSPSSRACLYALAIFRFLLPLPLSPSFAGAVDNWRLTFWCKGYEPLSPLPLGHARAWPAVVFCPGAHAA